MTYYNKKVILSGANGLIGKETLEPLLEKNFEVYALSSKKNINNSNNNINWIQCDIFDKLRLKEVFSNIQATHLLHFAWCTTGDYLSSDLNYEFKDASLEMLKLFAEFGGKKAVFAGTCFEYEFKNTPLEEDGELNPTTVYAQCKADLHSKSNEFCLKNSVDFGWGRIFYVYGKNEHEKRLTPHLFKNLENNKEVTISYASFVRDYMYSKDIASAFVEFLHSEVTGAVNICTGEGISLAEYANYIATLLNKKQFLIIKDEPSNQPPIIIGNAKRLFDEVGFKPKYTIKNGLKNLWEEDFQKNS